MDDQNMFQRMGEVLGVQPWVLQIMAFQADIHRQQVTYDFDATKFFGQHVGLTFGEQVPKTDMAVGKVVRSAIAATNVLAGGGAAGYLALIDLLMVSFRSDYHHADEMVQRYVLRLAERPNSGDAEA